MRLTAHALCSGHPFRRTSETGDPPTRIHSRSLTSPTPSYVGQLLTPAGGGSVGQWRIPSGGGSGGLEQGLPSFGQHCGWGPANHSSQSLTVGEEGGQGGAAQGAGQHPQQGFQGGQGGPQGGQWGQQGGVQNGATKGSMRTTSWETLQVG